jgi:hypothetical protein
MIAIIITGIVVCLAAAWVWTKKEHNTIQERFKDRIEIPPIDQLRSTFNSKDLDVERALAVWEKIAGNLQVSPGKLRLTDRFDIELAPSIGWEFDSTLADLNQQLTSLVDRKKSVNLASIKTIKDYLTLLCG